MQHPPLQRLLGGVAGRRGAHHELAALGRVNEDPAPETLDVAVGADVDRGAVGGRGRLGARGGRRRLVGGDGSATAAAAAACSGNAGGSAAGGAGRG